VKHYFFALAYVLFWSIWLAVNPLVAAYGIWRAASGKTADSLLIIFAAVAIVSFASLLVRKVEKWSTPKFFFMTSFAGIIIGLPCSVLKYAAAGFKRA